MRRCGPRTWSGGAGFLYLLHSSRRPIPLRLSLLSPYVFSSGSSCFFFPFCIRTSILVLLTISLTSQFGQRTLLRLFLSHFFTIVSKSFGELSTDEDMLLGEVNYQSPSLTPVPFLHIIFVLVFVTVFGYVTRSTPNYPSLFSLSAALSFFFARPLFAYSSIHPRVGISIVPVTHRRATRRLNWDVMSWELM